ncbi:NOTUM [Branchiostoma lanceolatum]|uniref:NOTUM protein n=1 Tax=Branchiostoma lanceolatum TaxID=7740 RepID=A0A8J9YUU2_BRALA|nr:NOTUM [Branchiostoma lanceolatum]
MKVRVPSDCEGHSALIDSAVVVQETDRPPSLKDLTVNVASQGSLQPEVSRPSHRSSRLLFIGVTVLVCAAVACAIVGVSVGGSPSAEATTTRSQHRRSTEQVELVRLSADKARETGAYCLDGTVPAYYFMRGFSGGEDKWRIVLEGGGYCESLAQCYAHSFTEFGTSRVLRPVPAGLGGFLSNNPDSNPEFYNWNTVFVHYCDGSSFTGNRPEPVTYRGKTLYFRGSRILDAILNDLLENRGLRNAERVILAGNSGTGSGKNKWRVHLDGGGSCDDLAECYSRSLTDNGSTRRLRTRDTFKGFLSTNQDENPDFFNWNVVYVHYCDGACFSSNQPDPVTQKGKTLYFRGKAILDAVLDELNDVRGLTNATTVILSGNSAGGIAVYRQADHVRSRLSPTVLYKVFPGSGLMVWDLTNPKHVDFFRRRAAMHGMLDGPDHPACLQAFPNDRWKCLLPQFAAPYVTSAMFVLNAAYDAWALKNILQLDCKPQSCRGSDRQALKWYQAEVIGVTANLDPGQGAFIPSCDDHSIIASSDYNEIMVGGKTPTEAFSDWFFDRTVNSSRYIDKMEWNPTC